MESIFLTAGGDIYVDKFNQTWFNDEAYATIPGNVSFQHCSPIRQTKDDKLYCSERYFPAVDSTDGNIGDSSWNIVGQYDIPVTTTDRIQVVLHFVERFYTAAKERVFDVIVEGEVMALSYDILSATNGETHTATYLATTTTVTDGNLTIAFVLGASAFPKINAIEIHHYSVAKDPESLIVPDEGTDWSQVSPPNASNTLNSPTSVPKKANGTVSGNSQPEDEPQTSGAVFVDDSNSTDEILAWSENWSSP